MRLPSIRESTILLLGVILLALFVSNFIKISFEERDQARSRDKAAEDCRARGGVMLETYDREFQCVKMELIK